MGCNGVALMEIMQIRGLGGGIKRKENGELGQRPYRLNLALLIRLGVLCKRLGSILSPTLALVMSFAEVMTFDSSGITAFLSNLLF